MIYDDHTPLKELNLSRSTGGQSGPAMSTAIGCLLDLSPEQALSELERARTSLALSRGPLLRYQWGKSV
jgi:hypothetical protein